jgi:hypothetical protein
MTVRLMLSLGVLTLALGCKGTRPDAPLTGTESLGHLMESMESAPSRCLPARRVRRSPRPSCRC